eukprot:CAMPEP_0174253054 /NCGR_PEP_ID=MMETSP0439-20130205/2445_1 /TAXON_ID=0 /ORGANISM="Stereomyxa ramosa, Strain Chinc5" /LENGTH=213 /DNA_ID=CAMNT_0015333861 /DNA_START=19 /DNA_END=660 /DNA_ORIENTATION=-
MEESSKVVLYSYWRSSCSYRVRIALAMKKIPYEYKAVHLVKDGGEQLQQAYADLNPSKELPTLHIDGVDLGQSLAILEYLDETRPDPPILPSSPTLRAQVRNIALVISADIQPVQNLRVLKYVGLDKKIEWGKHWITLGFEALEKILERTSGKYCVGDEVTMADLCLVPQVYNANRFGVEMDKFPNISRINEALCELPAFVEAHPDNQPDAEV